MGPILQDNGLQCWWEKVVLMFYYWSNCLFLSKFHSDRAITYVSFIGCIKGCSYVRLVKKDDHTFWNWMNVRLCHLIQCRTSSWLPVTIVTSWQLLLQRWITDNAHGSPFLDVLGSILKLLEHPHQSMDNLAKYKIQLFLHILTQKCSTSVLLKLCIFLHELQ